MTAGIIGFTRAETSETGYVRGHSTTPAILISPNTPTAPTADVFSHSEFDYKHTQQRDTGVEFVTWSWWSKKVLIQALELASQTFTLLSDELIGGRERENI